MLSHSWPPTCFDKVGKSPFRVGVTLRITCLLNQFVNDACIFRNSIIIAKVVKSISFIKGGTPRNRSAFIITWIKPGQDKNIIFRHS